MQREPAGRTDEGQSDKQNGSTGGKRPRDGEAWVWPDRPGDTHIRGHGEARLAAPARSAQVGKGFTARVRTTSCLPELRKRA